MDENLFGLDGLLPGDIFLIDDFEQPSPTEVSLAVDLTSVTENSGKEIKYTFTRKSTSELMLRQLDITNSTTVDTSKDLAVNFSIGGKAQLDSDYTLAGAVMNGTEYTVTIPVGATTATVTITPTPDSEIESDEAVKLTLEEGKDYIIADDSQQFDIARAVMLEGSSMDDNAVMAVITNDDPMWNAAWAKKFDDSGNGYGYEYLAVDDAGNTYVTGDVWKQAPASIDGTSITARGQYDTFVAKFDKDGKVEWAKNFGGSDRDRDNAEVEDITADSSGTYLTGTFRDEIIFGNDTLTSGGNGSDEVYVAKLDTTGNTLWAKSFGSAQTDEASGIEVDKDGNTYFTGEFEGQLQLANTTLDGGELGDVFVAKLDTNGDVLWGKEFDNPNYTDEAKDIVVDKEGNAYVFMTEGGEGDDNITLAKLNKSE